MGVLHFSLCFTSLDFVEVGFVWLVHNPHSLDISVSRIGVFDDFTGLKGGFLFARVFNTSTSLTRE